MVLILHAQLVHAANISDQIPAHSKLILSIWCIKKNIAITDTYILA